MKNNSLPRKQNKNISQNSKKFLNIISIRIQKTSMNKDLLPLIKKHTDTLIDQTKTKPQETNLETKPKKHKKRI